MASVIFACWAVLFLQPLAKFSGVESLAMLVPHEDGGWGRGSSQLTYLLCSASHGSCVCAPSLWLFADVAIGPSPRQLPHVPQSGVLHGLHVPHRSKVGSSVRVWGRLGPGIKGLCPGSSKSFFLSFFSILAILPNFLHLASFAFRTFLGTSPSAIFPALQVLASPKGCLLGLCVHGDG